MTDFDPTVARWLQDPEFLSLPKERRAGIISNYFAEQVSQDKEFQSIAPERQEAIRQNFTSVHMDAIPDSVGYDRGFFGDAGSRLARGGLGLVEAVGGGLRMSDLDPSKDEGLLGKTGQRITDFAEGAREKYDIFKPDIGEVTGKEGMLKRGFGGALESTIPSLAPLGGMYAGAKLGAAGGAVAGGPVGAAVGGVLGGAVGGLGTLFGTFFLGEYQNTYDEAVAELKKQGLPEQEVEEKAGKHALVSASAEFGGEVLGDFAALTFFGVLGRNAIKQSLKQTIKEITGQGGKNFLKAMSKTMPFEVGSEAGTAYVQASSAQNIGIPGMQPSEAMAESVIPAMILSVFFGGAVHGMQTMAAQKILADLNSQDPNTRQQAVDTISGRIEDAEQKQIWNDTAKGFIESGEQIPISKPITDFAVQKKAEESSPDRAEDVLSKLENDLYAGELTPEKALAIAPRLQGEFGIDPADIQTVVDGFQQKPELMPDASAQFEGEFSDKIEAAQSQAATDTAPQLFPQQTKEEQDAIEREIKQQRSGVTPMDQLLQRTRENQQKDIDAQFQKDQQFEDAKSRRFDDMRQTIKTRFRNIVPQPPVQPVDIPAAEQLRKREQAKQRRFDTFRQQLGSRLSPKQKVVEPQDVPIQPPQADVAPVQEVAKPAREEMIKEALRWQGAHINAEGEFAERGDKKGQFRIAKESGKSELDSYLMDRFGVDRGTAHEITNSITAQNLAPDKSAKVDDFVGQKWADDTVSARVTPEPQTNIPDVTVQPQADVPSAQTVTEPSVSAAPDQHVVAEPEAVKRGEPNVDAVEVEQTGATETTISVGIPQKQAEALSPKEQKKYMLAQIDEAIKSAQHKDVSGIGETERVKQIGTVTIQIPGDGEFTILNEKGALTEFKKLAQRDFPDKITQAPKTKAQPPRATGKRIKGNGELTYYNPFQVRKEKILQIQSLSREGKTVGYEGGFYTDGGYALKTSKPTKIKGEMRTGELAPGIKKIIDEQAGKKGQQKALVVGEFVDTNTDPIAHIVSEGGALHVFVKPQYVDSILTAYPNATPQITDASSPVLFMDKGKPVGLIAPLDMKEYGFDGTPESLSDVIKEGYARVANDSAKDAPRFDRRNRAIDPGGAPVAYPERRGSWVRLSPSDRRKAAQRVVDRLASSWGNAPPIVLLNSQADLPKPVANYLRSIGAETDIVDGVFFNGKVYLVSENLISPFHTFRTVIHEVTGHYGIRGTLGSDLDTTLNGIYKSQKDAIADVAKNYKLDLNTKEGRMEATEEWLAREAESNPKSGPVNRMIAAIRKLLRKIFPNMAFSNGDIRALIADARRYVEGGRGTTEGRTSFSKDKMADQWYSQLQKTLEAKLPGTGTPAHIKQMVAAWEKKGEFKSDELAWVGLNEWLDTQDGKVTKQEVLDFVAANNVQLVEVTKEDTVTKTVTIPLEDFSDSQLQRALDAEDLTEFMDSPYSRAQAIELLREQIGNSGTSAEANIYDAAGVPPPAPDGAPTTGEVYGTKFAGYQEPGGENYREVLLTLPDTKRGAPQEITELPDGYDLIRDRSQSDDMQWGVTPPGQIHAGPFAGRHATKELATEAAIRAINRNAQREWKKGSQFKGSHWDEPNVLVHVRLNDRRGPNGEKILFVEEVQSDWHQKGRKEGYRGDAKVVEIKTDSGKKVWRVQYPDGTFERGIWESQSGAETFAETEGRGIPNAPFKGSKNWSMLAIKRLVRMAAEQGYDSIAWTPGEVQVGRYKEALQSAVDKIEWTKTKDGIQLVGSKNGREVVNTVEKENAISDAIGKSMGDSIIADPNQSGVFEGDEITISDTGMAGFYDKILPAEVNKFFNKAAWGKAKVGTVDIDAGEYKVNRDSRTPPYRLESVDSPDIISRHNTAEEAWAEAERLGSKEVWNLPITPEMRQKALREGMPLFKRAESTDPNHKAAEAFNKEYPGYSVEYDGIQEGYGSIKDRFQFTIREGIAENATFTSATADMAGIKEGVDRMVGMREKVKPKEQKEKPLFSRTPKLDAEADAYMDKLKSLWTPKGVLSPKKTARLIDKYESLTKDLKEAREDIYKKQAALEKHIRENLPPAERYRVMAYIKRMASVVNKSTRQQRFDSAIEKVEQAHQRVAKIKALKEFKKTIDKKKPHKTERGVEANLGMDPEANRLVKKIRSTYEKESDEVLGDLLETFKAMDKEGREPTPEEMENILIGQMFGGIEKKNTDQINAATEMLKSIIKDGRARWQTEELNRKERMDELRDTWLDELTGGEGIKKAEVVDLEKRAGIWKSISDGLRAYDTMHQSFEFLLDKLSRYDQKSKPLEGKTTDYFARMVHAATHAESANIRKEQNKIHLKLVEIYGKKRLAHKLQKNTELVKKTGVFRYYQDGQVIEKPLSQNTAYKLWQMFQQPSIREEMEAHGYTRQTLSQLEKFINPKVMKWAKWQIEEFYPNYRDGINDIYKKLFYVDMPMVEVYSPISRQYESQSVDDALLGEGGHYVSLLASAVKSRTKNMRDFNILDGDSVLMKHIVEMEHFKAWGIPMREMRSVLGAPNIQTAIKQYHGTAANTALKQFMDHFASGGIDRANTLNALDKLRANFTRSVLGANPVVFLKQLASIPAYALDMPVSLFVTGFASFFKNPMKAYKTLMESEMMQNRYESGFERDIMLALQRSTVKHMTHTKTVSDFLMLATKLGDKMAIMAGGWANYQYHLKKLKDRGMDHDAAHKKALVEFERSTERSQQAGNIKDLAHVQRLGSIGKLFTMFMTAPASYYRNVASGLRNLKAGRGSRAENLKRMAVGHFVLPMIFQWVASGFDWEEDKMLRAMVVGPLNGLFIARDAIEGFATAVFEGHAYFSLGVTPPLSTIQKTARAGVSINKAISDGFDGEYAMKATIQLLESAGLLTGIPFGTVKRTVAGIKDASEQETERPIRRILGFPELKERE